MNTYKKIIMAVMSLVLIMSLTACNSDYTTVENINKLLNTTNCLDKNNGSVTYYLCNEIDKSDNKTVILKVHDIIVNNPACVESYTVIADIDGEAKYLYVNARDYWSYPSQTYIELSISKEDGLNYITEENEYGYSQYIEIRETDEVLKSDAGDKYKVYECKLYVQDVTGGENKKGKHGKVQSGRIGN